MLRKYAPILLLLLVTTLFLGSISLVDAQKNQGDFVSYSFSYSSTKNSQTKNGDGTFREEIVKDFENGTLRVKYSGTANSAVFMLEKNTPESRFSFPYLPELKNGTMIFKLRNATITLAIARLPDETVNFQGSSYRLNVSKIDVTYEVIRGANTFTGSANGIVKVFKSGLIYSFNGQFKGSSTGDVNIVLASTNLNPEAKAEPNNLLMQAANLAEIGSLVNGNGRPEASTTSATQSYMLIAALVGIVAVIIGVTYGRKKITSSSRQNEKPLHWVD
ncbi:MAG: hypothetical protein HYU02_07875 [Thaumarchaeota archaeon]|nr:hypothetical protein [Nitrososphaerota archaeon]